MPETVTLATFGAQLNEEFTLTPPDGPAVAVRLVEATPLGPAPADGLRAPFSIVFRGPADRALGQGMYRLGHAAIGSFELFLVPIAPDADGRRYEAVFA